MENNEEKGGEKVVRLMPPKQAVIGVFILALSGSLLLLSMFFTNLKEYGYIGRDISSQTTITVIGDGEAYAPPDIAAVSFAITQDAKTPAEASTIVDISMKKIRGFLSSSGVAEKDIKTTGYNLNPKYEWQQKQIICIAYPCVQPQGKQVLVGYTVTHSIEVKVRNLDDAGKILGGLTDNGATDISGLTFMVENEDAVKSDVRKEAITKAKAKAAKLADDLGVTLVRIVSFNEGGSPIMFARESMSMKAMSADYGAPAPALDVSPGENKYTSNVTLVYEIR